MGNIINPIGGRLGFMTFWRTTWPVFFNQKLQNLFFQLSLHVKIVFNNFFQRLSLYFPKFSSRFVLHGLMLNLITNFWGFNNQNLTIFFKFFDYKVTVVSLEFFKNRSFVAMLIRRVRKLFRLKNWVKGNPLVKVFNKIGVSFSKTKRYVFNSLRHRGSKVHSTAYIKFYIKRGIGLYLKFLHKRLFRWHFNIILFTKPYILFLCKQFGLRSCSVYSRVIRSSVSAMMIVRYMVLKIKQGFKLNFVLNSVRRALKSFLRRVSGYKLCLAGRFTRKQIATYRWVKFGDLSLNQQASGVDYAQGSGISKFGLFGIKFWVFKHPNINEKY